MVLPAEAFSYDSGKIIPFGKGLPDSAFEIEEKANLACGVIRGKWYKTRGSDEVHWEQHRWSCKSWDCPHCRPKKLKVIFDRLGLAREKYGEIYLSPYIHPDKIRSVTEKLRRRDAEYMRFALADGSVVFFSNVSLDPEWKELDTSGMIQSIHYFTSKEIRVKDKNKKVVQETEKPREEIVEEEEFNITTPIPIQTLVEAHVMAGGIVTEQTDDSIKAVGTDPDELEKVLTEMGYMVQRRKRVSCSRDNLNNNIRTTRARRRRRPRPGS